MLTSLLVVTVGYSGEVRVQSPIVPSLEYTLPPREADALHHPDNVNAGGCDIALEHRLSDAEFLLLRVVGELFRGQRTDPTHNILKARDWRRAPEKLLLTAYESMLTISFVAKLRLTPFARITSFTILLLSAG